MVSSKDQPSASGEPTDGHYAAPLRFVLFLRRAGAVGIVEAAILLVTTIAMGIAAFHSSGSRGEQSSANVFLVVIFVIFALLIALVSRSLLRSSTSGRPAFLLIQVFVLIAAWTVFSGGTAVVKAAGVLIGLLALLGGYWTIRSIAAQPDVQ